MATYYERLGVPPGADAADLQAAYRRRARELHPDAAPAGRDGAAMAGLNEAWHVLRDPTRRARYDASIGVTGVGATPPWRPGPDRSDLDLDLDLDPDVAGSWHGGGASLRFGPPPLWTLVLVVLAAIFVITAYAGGSHDPARRPAMAGSCLAQQPGVDAIVPCSTPHTARIITQVSHERDCPNGTSPHKLLGRETLVCVDVGD